MNMQFKWEYRLSDVGLFRMHVKRSVYQMREQNKCVISEIKYRLSSVHGFHPESAVFLRHSLHGDHPRPEHIRLVNVINNQNAQKNIVFWEQQQHVRSENNTSNMFVCLCRLNNSFCQQRDCKKYVICSWWFRNKKHVFTLLKITGKQIKTYV